MGSRWRGKTEESCKLVVNNIYLWKMLFLLQNALSFQAPSFAVDFNAQLGQMSSIQIPHPDPNSLARLLGHKPAKKVPEILWSLYSVERLRFQKKKKNYLHSSLIDKVEEGWGEGKNPAQELCFSVNCSNTNNTGLRGCNWPSPYVRYSHLCISVSFPRTHYGTNMGKSHFYWFTAEKAKFSCIEPETSHILLSTCFLNTFLPYKKKKKKNSVSLKIWIILFPDSTSAVLIWRKLISKLFCRPFILPQTAANKLRRLQTSEEISNK